MKPNPALLSFDEWVKKAAGIMSLLPLPLVRRGPHGGSILRERTGRGRHPDVRLSGLPAGPVGFYVEGILHLIWHRALALDTSCHAHGARAFRDLIRAPSLGRLGAYLRSSGQRSCGHRAHLRGWLGEGPHRRCPGRPHNLPHRLLPHDLRLKTPEHAWVVWNVTGMCLGGAIVFELCRALPWMRREMAPPAGEHALETGETTELRQPAPVADPTTRGWFGRRVLPDLTKPSSTVPSLPLRG